MHHLACKYLPIMISAIATTPCYPAELTYEKSGKIQDVSYPSPGCPSATVSGSGLAVSSKVRVPMPAKYAGAYLPPANMTPKIDAELESDSPPGSYLAVSTSQWLTVLDVRVDTPDEKYQYRYDGNEIARTSPYDMTPIWGIGPSIRTYPINTTSTPSKVRPEYPEVDVVTDALIHLPDKIIVTTSSGNPKTLLRATMRLIWNLPQDLFPPWKACTLGGRMEYKLKSIPIRIQTRPTTLNCGKYAGTATQWCNSKFDVVKDDGSGLPPGVLSFGVPSTKPGDPTMARMGDAGFLELIYHNNAVRLDGSPIRTLGNEMAPIFVPRITPTGRGNGPATLSITVTFTAD